MKQNERLLVYAVTGFLAIILLVAVLFGPSGQEAAAKSGGAAPANGAARSDGVRGLNDILGQAGTADASKTDASKTDASKTDAATKDSAVDPKTGAKETVHDALVPNPVTQQPLVAAERPLIAMDLVAQQLGPSRRDRTVRMVRARAGDSLEKLVQRWCGARDPFLDEAKSLNEDLVVLKVGQEVCVPWVDDEIVLAAYEASKPKTLVSTPPAASNDPAAYAPSPTTRPTFAEPGTSRTEPGTSRTEPGASRTEPGASRTEPGASRPDAGTARDAAKVPSVAAAGTEYLVKSGDSLWRIADRTYGQKNAAKMVGEIKKANPEIGDTLRAGQKILLPAAPQ